MSARDNDTSVVNVLTASCTPDTVICVRRDEKKDYKWIQEERLSNQKG